jgi:hypothetical protein
MRLPAHRTVWISAALLLSIVGVWLSAPRSRITQANFDRIRYGMSKDDVAGILGRGHEMTRDEFLWYDGPNWIYIVFTNGNVAMKHLTLESPLEVLIWYVKEGTRRIGVIPR